MTLEVVIYPFIIFFLSSLTKNEGIIEYDLESKRQNAPSCLCAVFIPWITNLAWSFSFVQLTAFFNSILMMIVYLTFLFPFGYQFVWNLLLVVIYVTKEKTKDLTKKKKEKTKEK